MHSRRPFVIEMFIILILFVLAVGILYFYFYSKNTSVPPKVQSFSTVSYFCDSGKTITASYYRGIDRPAAGPDQPPRPGGSVALVLSDGRQMTLSQTISADGVRYARADDSFVFWSRGNGALVLEDGEQKSYTGCISAAPEPVGANLPQVYANGTAGFSIRLPSLATSTLAAPDSYHVDASYEYQALGPGHTINGIKFTIPASLAAGTNLSPDTYLSVEEIPQTRDCSASLFLYRGVTATTTTEGDTTYSVASSNDAAAGNRYHEIVYALPGTNPCIAVRYFIHYGVFENYPPGAVSRFDESALIGQFDAIRRTLVIAP